MQVLSNMYSEVCLNQRCDLLDTSVVFYTYCTMKNKEISMSDRFQVSSSI